MQQRPPAPTSFPSPHSQDAPLTRQTMQPASHSTTKNHPANPKPSPAAPTKPSQQTQRPLNLDNHPPQTTTPNTLAERVRVTDTSTRFTLDLIPRQQAGNRLKISEEVLMDTAEQWNRCMVGFFPGFKMPYHTVNTIASQAWKHRGLKLVMTTSNGFMIFRFKSETEM